MYDTNMHPIPPASLRNVKHWKISRVGDAQNPISPINQVEQNAIFVGFRPKLKAVVEE